MTNESIILSLPETLTCFSDPACDGKVEAAAFIALGTPIFLCVKNMTSAII